MCILVTFLGAMGWMVAVGAEVDILNHVFLALLVLGLLGVFVTTFRNRKKRSRNR